MWICSEELSARATDHSDTDCSTKQAKRVHCLLTIFVGAAADSLGRRDLACDCALVHFAATGQQHDQLACHDTKTNTCRWIAFAGRVTSRSGCGHHLRRALECTPGRPRTWRRCCRCSLRSWWHPHSVPFLPDTKDPADSMLRAHETPNENSHEEIMC